MRKVLSVAVGALLMAAWAQGAGAQEMVMPEDGPRTASAVMIDTLGNRIGTAELVETPSYGVLIRLDIEGLSPGTHAFHIHQTGQCSPPSFSSAGGHYAPRGRSHGVLYPHGRHAGDLMNLHVPASGAVQTERLAEHVSLIPGTTGFLLDDDGSSFVIHAAADDYRSQPAGAAGPRVTCGVIR